jgi:SSS family solute:Na+ symporter
MLVLYAATIVWGTLGTLLSLWLVKLTESALDIWWTLAGIFGGGITGLFLLGQISRRARSPAALAGVLAGMIAILWLSLPKVTEYLLKLPPDTVVHGVALQMQQSLTKWGSPFHAFLVPVFGTLVILLVGLAASRLRKSHHSNINFEQGKNS